MMSARDKEESHRARQEDLSAQGKGDDKIDERYNLSTVL